MQVNPVNNSQNFQARIRINKAAVRGTVGATTSVLGGLTAFLGINGARNGSIEDPQVAATVSLLGVSAMIAGPSIAEGNSKKRPS